VAKVIRPVRISSNVVTLGQAVSGLYLDQDDGEEVGIDMAALVARRAENLQGRLETEWRDRLEAERQRLEGEGSQTQESAQLRWDQERAELVEARYQEGYAAGVEAKEEEVRQALERLEALHEAFANQRRKIVREAETLVVEVALGLGRRITGLQAETDPKILARVMRRALENLAESGEITVRVHPDDLQLARRFAAHWVKKVEEDTVLKVRPGANIEPGGCMIEGVDENIDARLEAQFRVLGEELRQAVLGAGAENNGEDQDGASDAEAARDSGEGGDDG
jgi:flagellar biosynthesis/type III secretory pathway protein FliH